MKVSPVSFFEASWHIVWSIATTLYQFVRARQEYSLLKELEKDHTFTNLFDQVCPQEKKPNNSDLKPIASYAMPNGTTLSVAFGPITRFVSHKGAIAVAANKKLAPYSDNVIIAGGKMLKRARRQLLTATPFKCQVGKAYALGPKYFGSFRVPFLVHAVAPDYRNYGDDSWDWFKNTELLFETYKNVLMETVGKPIDQLVLPVLPSKNMTSFSGEPGSQQFAAHAVEEIKIFEREYTHLKDIILCTECIIEAEELIKGCDQVLGSSTLKVIKCKE